MPHRTRLVAVLIAGALAPIAASADSVYLKNGQSFEGVEAVVSGDTVQIELEIGRLRLPMSKVERIDEVSSTLGEYREREARLGNEREDATGWAELARWARANDFDQGAHKAALVAARLDPDLPELEPLMAAFDYELDAKAHEWVPSDAMRRHDPLEDPGDRVTLDDRRSRADARVEAVSPESRSRTDDHLDKALDILADAINRPDAPAATTVAPPPGYGYGGFGYYPGIGGFFGGGGGGGGVIDPGTLLPGAIIRSDIHAAWSAMALRQPASFIPLPSNAAPRHIDPITHRFVR
jgi:hypothetical protein